MKLLGVVAAIGVSLLLGAAAQAAQPAAATCKAPGKFVFYDIATKRAELPAATHKTFSALGLKAKLNDCAIAVVCTPAATGEDRHKIAGQRCAAVRQALARHERRPDFRKGLQDAVEKLAPKGLNYPAGSTVVILR